MENTNDRLRNKVVVSCWQTGFWELRKPRLQKGRDDSFSIFDLGDVIRKYQMWKKYFPRVKPFYATKCNNDHQILSALVACGASFDCASKAEIKQVLDLGVSADKIIYAHPCKHPSMLRFAAKKGVDLMTFDNEAELYKIKEIFPDAKCLLRILPSGKCKARFDLGEKFGCPVSAARKILTVASALSVNVVGISFHVGSVCQDTAAYVTAIKDAREAFDMGLQGGHDMRILNIGGGFSGEYSQMMHFLQIAETVNLALDQLFPADDNVDIMAEPGRYFVASAVTVAACIIGKHVMVNEKINHAEDRLTDRIPSVERLIMYYIGEGVHGWLNFRYQETPDLIVNTLQNDHGKRQIYESSIWGPTCDSLDCISKRTKLPEHELGEWLYFKCMGAYTLTTASRFNGMPKPRRYYVCQRDLCYVVRTTLTWLRAYLRMSAKGTLLAMFTKRMIWWHFIQKYIVYKALEKTVEDFVDLDYHNIDEAWKYAISERKYLLGSLLDDYNSPDLEDEAVSVDEVHYENMEPAAKSSKI